MKRDALLRPAEAAYRKALTVSRIRRQFEFLALFWRQLCQNRFSRMNMPARGRSLLLVPILCATFLHAQALDFQLQTHPDGPVALLNFAPSTIRSESDRRRFLTVQNESDKIAAAVVFQQTIGSGPSAEIVTIERVSIIIRPRETNRLSVSIRDVSNQL